ncbi:MAG: NUDIX domain-containing protein [Deltaproteobacteria bacterium]|nr:NUDIX domain-containing protein [Deltaproteobacteria bacterium]
MSGCSEEIFEILDEQDRVIGRAPRRLCHGDPSLIHRVAHVMVFNKKGELLLQKRSPDKDIQPGRWDTSVGGHLALGEDYRAAAGRETREELGLENLALTYLYGSRIRNEIESENVATFMAVAEGPFAFDTREIETVRFWTATEIAIALGSGVFTSHFEEEWRSYLRWRQGRAASGQGHPPI